MAEAEPMLTGFATSRGYRNFRGLGWIVIARRPTSVAYASANDLVLTILGSGVLLAALGIGAAAWIAGRVVGPIRALAAEADRIGRDPGAVTLPHMGGSPEITQLSTALRSLLRRIDVSQQEVATVERRSEEERRQLTESIDALKDLADHDPLTGLPNRRGIERFSTELMSDYQRNGRVFAAFVIDIDHFKSVNDTHGHAAGDAVIQRVGQLVDSTLRPSDRTARFGGEEFVSFLRDAPLVRAGEVAERIRAAVEGAGVMHTDDVVRVTVSIGVTVVSPGDRDLQDVIERADAALYEAKSSGRNRVVLRTGRQHVAERAA
jgi:diguanylate cyclase (GGDEF)-like protein